jgi:hypothetical protein
MLKAGMFPAFSFGDLRDSKMKKDWPFTWIYFVGAFAAAFITVGVKYWYPQYYDWISLFVWLGWLLVCT